MNILKKIHLSRFLLAIAICCFAVEASAQSPRLQLFEYFDNTTIPINIGALAKANYDSLAAANTGKLITLTYHVAWGSQTGTDPMNLDNPVQVQTRVTYYGVTGDPHGIQDGGDSTLNLFRDHPVNLRQHHIDSRDSVSAPFTIAVSHTLNSARDSITCHAVIKKTGTATGTLKAHMVVIEKQIRFSTAPGISGETSFNNVMKRMLPTDQGTTLGAMNIGDSLVLNLKWKLANVYDTTSLAVVCFVQNAATFEVHQAGYSPPHVQQNDAATLSVSAGDFSCDSITPVVVLQNGGNATLVSCTINYQIDNGTPVSTPWSGSLASGASTNVTLPAVYAAGYHTLKVFSANPNGTADPVHFNDTTITYFSNASLPSQDSVAEGFESAFAPADWAIGNPDANMTWEQDSAGGFGNSVMSAALHWFDVTAGETDDLYVPTLDLGGTDTVALSFDVAYARYDATYHDTLQVRVSTDCGATWTVVYSKTGTPLATAPDTTEKFVPTSSQWRQETVDLTAFAGETKVLVQFHGISGYGNFVYLDNIQINVEQYTGIEAFAAAHSVQVFPNPFSDALTFRTSGSEPLEITLYDITSKKLVQQTFTSVISINTSAFSNGIYFYEIRNKSGVIENGKVVKE